MKSKSKDEIVRLVWTLAGAILGLGAGLGLQALTFSRFTSISASTGALPGLLVMAFCGGGLIGGGYLALWLISRRQRAARRQYFEEKKKKQRKSKSRK